MIIQRAEEKVQVSGSVQRYQAGIAINAETFSILIDGIYNDKVLAAVREPLFNAVDSHTEAGCREKPIIIHSPSDLEPWYSVRDRGLGMDFNMVTQTFMMLGSSTKRESNELIGAKGIGSKAPFTVTDMFTVTSVKNGIKTVYSVHKNEGIPEVVPLHESETDEENGVEIKFNVDPSETGKYRQAIVKCLRYAKFPYEINDPFVTSEINDRTYPIQYRYEDKDTGWILEMYGSVSRNADSVVVMGQQPYLSNFLSTNKEWPMMMVSIPIGDCDVNPGREWTIEGKNDRGFRDRLEQFVNQAIEKRGEEVVKELQCLPTLKEVLGYMKRVGGYFSNRFGSGFIADKFKEHFGTFKVENCISFGGKGSKRLKDQNYGYSELMNGYPLVYDDDHKCIRSKCQWLSEKRDMRVFVTELPEALDILEDPFFDGMVFKLSDLEKRPVQKSDKKYGGYGLYEPGHAVWIIEQDGSVHKTRISRAQFDDIDAAMIYSGGQVKGDCPLGSVSSLTTRYTQSETFLKELGVEGKLYIVPLNRANWLPEGTRFIGRDDLYELAKTNLMEYHLRQLTDTHEYKQMVNNLAVFDVVVQKDPEYVTKVRMSYSLSNIQGYFKIEGKAERIVKARLRIGKKLLAAKKAKYPLLKYIDLKHFNSPEMVEYRQLIDSKGENK